VPISELALSEVPNVIPNIKQIMKSDREVLDKVIILYYVFYCNAVFRHK
jgi:hypothetical protein